MFHSLQSLIYLFKPRSDISIGYMKILLNFGQHGAQRWWRHMTISRPKSPNMATLFSYFSRKYISTKCIFLSHLQRGNLTWKTIKRKSEVKQKSSCSWNKFVEPNLLNQPIIIFLSEKISLGLFFIYWT